MVLAVIFTVDVSPPESKFKSSAEEYWRSEFVYKWRGDTKSQLAGTDKKLTNLSPKYSHKLESTKHSSLLSMDKYKLSLQI